MATESSARFDWSKDSEVVSLSGDSPSEVIQVYVVCSKMKRPVNEYEY